MVLRADGGGGGVGLGVGWGVEEISNDYVPVTTPVVSGRGYNNWKEVICVVCYTQSFNCHGGGSEK